MPIHSQYIRDEYRTSVGRKEKRATIYLDISIPWSSSLFGSSLTVTFGPCLQIYVSYSSTVQVGFFLAAKSLSRSTSASLKYIRRGRHLIFGSGISHDSR